MQKCREIPVYQKQIKKAHIDMQRYQERIQETDINIFLTPQGTHTPTMSGLWSK